MKKICYKCGIVKPLSEFYTDKSRKDGLCNKCKVCDNKKRKTYYLENRLKAINNIRINHLKKKNKCLEYYGAVCACCGESNPGFLTIDHIGNNGAIHRKQIKYQSIYNWLVTNNFPDGFQVLCWNCNSGKYYNGGICPHKNIWDGT